MLGSIMRIRTQLLIAFLFLAIVPLTGIVLYSYYSSLNAVRDALEADARSLLDDMTTRMAELKTDLGDRIERVAVLAPEALNGTTDAASYQRMQREITAKLGDKAPLVNQFEFTPIPPVPSVAPAPPANGEANPVLSSGSNSRVIVIDVRNQLKGVPGIDPSTLPEPMTITVPEPPVAPKPGEAPSIEQQKQVAAMEKQIEKAQRAAEQTQLEAAKKQVEVAARHRVHLQGTNFEMPVFDKGTEVGRVRVRVNEPDLLREVWPAARRDSGEIAFARDESGELFTADEGDRAKLANIGLPAASEKPDVKQSGSWLVASMRDPETQLSYGIARPIAEPLEEVRRTAIRNFSYGLGLIVLALLGTIPVANHLTRDVKVMTAGAERISGGDLDTRVPVRSQNEFGQLAAAFNRMAADLKDQQQKLLDEERLREQQELQQKILAIEYDRKTKELEEARNFQLSLLPKSIPRHPSFEIAVYMKTATEVGGDYYDFLLGANGALTTAIGDATGHGAKAGTMVTIVKSLFTARGADLGVGEFLDEATRAIRRMELGRMSMALALLRFEGQKATIASAGMPPMLVYRRDTRRVQEIALEGLPLGTIEQAYRSHDLEIAPGDTVLLTTDGFPELLNADNEPIGYPAVRNLFERAAANAPAEIIRDLAAMADEWSGHQAPSDDITFVVIRHV